ncbi:hypothetical protein [Halalkalibacter alkalisediminis]|uniref:DUF4203 domain-containing protein n=1 Tax=Halalkalibacter alkalisediminis TaxID=935616 RepID=A0ABV6NG18_9BACI|nr:hypothetical protein [Halalkalibacter alkalisediminis]
MSTGLLLFFILSTFLFVCYYVVIAHYRQEEKMSLMMTAMAGGMTAGLLFGALMGILLRGDFVQSTILGIVIGMTIGAFLGLPAQLLATLEGMLAGLMGGMMGAMVGEMSPIGQEDTLLKFMFMISLIVFLFTVRLFYSETTSNMLQFLRNPLLALMLVLIVFLALENVGPFFPEHETDPKSHMHSVFPDDGY